MNRLYIRNFSLRSFQTEGYKYLTLPMKIFAKTVYKSYLFLKYAV